MTEPERLRADAARNRAAILRATEELLARHHPQQISMEQVAAAAGVGKGTVFHRFGSRHGLMRALIQERAQDLEVAISTGPPPLGVGAPPRERLLAFLTAAVDLVARNKGLLAALGPEAPVTAAPDRQPREAHPVYRRWHGHLSDLVQQQRPDLDTDMLAHVLLATLHSEPILNALERGDGSRLDHTLRDVVTALMPDEDMRTGRF
ncbi:AcrR family transcriptional regulator [Actinoplanes octamycinicus]|uniref:AcrR family transcriptional regulator n=1 Tax=Actinoplanes octamycinicus TaxID=135948 RepID=A0A7W7M9G8_9ACTN|nr:TetR/AcrR family transcriptional regulator [Actinoplanes octamycinicus]MBB4741979.1 AcrR family transcriptional regulator [Actinoplanes octamycinicus]GIE60742.1 TetR family transcriptional regulator [Actinoplanes octamycinicus]